MSAPVIATLGASSVNRKWVLEVNTATAAAPNWLPVAGVKNFQPVTDNANWADDSRFTGQGYQSQTKTSTAWSATCTIARAPQLGTTTYDVAQEYLRTHSEGVFGAANTVQVRFYEWEPTGTMPRTQAYTGFAGVGWAEQGGAYDALSDVVVTLTNTADGKLLPISHPFPLTAAAPAVTAVDRTLAAAGGTLAHVRGSAFTGATALTVGGNTVATTAFTVDSDGQITFSAPAHTAGANLPVVVTTPAGASPAANVATYV